MQEKIVSASIIAADCANLEREIHAIKEAGVKWVHNDIMDGHFVPNITLGIPVISSLRKKTDLFFDTHLMIQNPEKYIKPFADAGSDLITFHIEASESVAKTHEIISMIESCGKKIGLSIKPATPLEKVLPFLNKIDLLLIMSVEPGFAGQKFMPEALDKISKLRSLASENLIIEVDGGINDSNARQCIENGADVLVAGSYLFSHKDYSLAVRSLIG